MKVFVLRDETVASQNVEFFWAWFWTEPRDVCLTQLAVAGACGVQSQRCCRCDAALAMPFACSGTSLPPLRPLPTHGVSARGVPPVFTATPRMCDPVDSQPSY